MKSKEYLFRSGIIILLFFISKNLYTQTSGYLGMRNHIYGNVFFMPSLRDSNSTINLVLIGGFSHIWSRNFSTGITYQQFSTQFGYKSELTQRFGRGLINGWGAGINARWYYFFSWGTIAPIGPYQEIQVSYQHATIYDKYGRYYPKPNDIPNYRIGDQGGIAIGTSIGEQRAIYKSIILSYGMNFRYVFPEIHKSYHDEYLSPIIARRIRGFQAISFSLGIGALIF